MSPKPKPKEDPILVSVDFSPHSERALLWGVDLAEVLKAPLVVLHIVRDPGETLGYYSVKGGKKQLKKREDVASDMLDQFMRKIIKKRPEETALEAADTSLVVGLPVNRVLETAEKIEARMIVMGSQGRTGLAHMLLGSNAENIVHLSPVPVTIVKTKKTEINPARRE